MYSLINWLDHIVQYKRRFKVTEGEAPDLKYLTPSPGEIEQQGTQQSSTNFNHMDRGILESALMNAFFASEIKQQGIILENLNGTTLKATLNNTYKYPSTNSTQTITLPKRLNNLDYKLSYEIEDAIGGYVEDVQFFDKALNAFKVKYFGSASQVKLKIYVVGGIY